MMENTKKEITLIFKKIIYLCILVVLSVSCDWNSSEKTNTESAGSEEIEETTKDSAFVVDVKALDYAFGMPSEIPSGWITFRMENLGKEVHHGVIAKFVDTLSYEKLSQMISKAVKESTQEAYDPLYAVMEKDYGGPAMLSPGLTGETTVYLEPGLYTLSCHLKTSEGIYHMDRGMNRPFVVTSKKVDTQKPQTTVDLTLSNFAIELGPVSAGDQIFNVNYEDYDYHNVHLAKLEQDQKMEDLMIWMTRAQMPSPYRFLGGAEQVPVGKTSTFKAFLEPGRYAFVAFGQSIAGMAVEITVPKKGKSVPVDDENINKEVIIKIDLEKTDYPQQLPIGRTPIAIKNTGDREYRYILSLLKKGSSKEDFEDYLENNIVEQKVETKGKKNPSYQIWENILSPDEEDKFSLKVEERDYVLLGPLIPGKSLKSQWRKQNLIHIFNGRKISSE